MLNAGILANADPLPRCTHMLHMIQTQIIKLHIVQAYASTLVGILTCPFLRSWWGRPYLQPTPLASLPLRPALSTLMSLNTKSHLLWGTTFCARSSACLASSSSFFSAVSAARRSSASLRRSSKLRPEASSRSASTNSGWGIRLSAGRRLLSKALPASSRVKCLDSATGTHNCWRVAGCTIKSLMGSWTTGRLPLLPGLEVSTKGVVGNISSIALEYGIAKVLPCFAVSTGRQQNCLVGSGIIGDVQQKQSSCLHCVTM